jgi:hypothetical protein
MSRAASKLPADIEPGDRFTASGVEVVALRHPVAGSEPWGSPTLRIWAKRSDTGAEGFVTYGPSAKVELSESK